MLGLSRQLLEDGLLISGEGGRPRKVMRVGGHPLRVLCLPREKLAAFTGEEGWLGKTTPAWVHDGDLPLGEKAENAAEEPF